MNYENNTAIEIFLKSCHQYSVLHEKSPSKENLEHYFIAISILDAKNSSVESFLKTYQGMYPIFDIANSSKNYIEKNNNKYIFIFLDSLDKSDLFFIEKEKCLKQNVGNIISIRMLGQPIDLKGYLGSQAEKYLIQFKNISDSIFYIAKEEIRNGLGIGAKKFNEQSPIIKKKLENFKNKIIKPK